MYDSACRTVPRPEAAHKVSLRWQEWPLQTTCVARQDAYCTHKVLPAGSFTRSLAWPTQLTAGRSSPLDALTPPPPPLASPATQPSSSGWWGT